LSVARTCHAVGVWAVQQLKPLRDEITASTADIICSSLGKLYRDVLMKWKEKAERFYQLVNILMIFCASRRDKL